MIDLGFNASAGYGWVDGRCGRKKGRNWASWEKKMRSQRRRYDMIKYNAV